MFAAGQPRKGRCGIRAAWEDGGGFGYADEPPEP